MATITEALKTDIAHIGDLKRTAGGDLQTISGLANLKGRLFHRLITVPGTLVHRPLYGVGIGRFQNAPISFAVQQQIANLIVEQFGEDPGVQSVSSVKITSEDNMPQRMKVAVFVVPVGYTETQMLFTPFGAGI